MNRFRFAPVALLQGLALVPVGGTVQTRARQEQPGFNLFSIEQDIEIGRQSAIEAEKQLTLLNNRNVDRYLNRVIQKLAAAAPGASYPYQIKAVNASDINAFALPGGPMYVNRGLIEAARSEAELAGVLAHEMSHVALRHGTHQASKAYLAQAGLGILGGLIGKGSGSTSKVLNTIGGVGLNAVFLKFSRDDEYQADRVGAEIMSRAGYDANAMANFFGLLKAEQGSNPGKVEQFFSSHPAPADREERIRVQAKSLGAGSTQLVGGFDVIRRTVQSSPTASSGVAQMTYPPTADTVVVDRVDVNVERPSQRFLEFSQSGGFFTVQFPENWRTYPSGFAVSMAPEGGVVTTRDGRQVMLYGAIINHYAPFEGAEARRRRSLTKNYAPFEDKTARRGSLEDATDDLLYTIMQSNSYLRVMDDVAVPETIDGQAGFSVSLAGRSPVTGQEERVKVYTRGLPDGHVLYALGIVPGGDDGSFERAFTRMLRSLRVDDAAAHRTKTTVGVR